MQPWLRLLTLTVKLVKLPHYTDVTVLPLAFSPDDARPIVRHPTDLLVAAGYDRAWPRTQGL